jgi:hypothetical protein
MVTITIVGDVLHLEIEGSDKLWALKSRLEVPLAHISGVRVHPPEGDDWWKGWKLGGTQLGQFTAGHFYYHGRHVFWDVHNPERSIGLTLNDERYSELVLEVENPDAEVSRISQALHI